MLSFPLQTPAQVQLLQSTDQTVGTPSDAAKSLLHGPFGALGALGSNGPVTPSIAPYKQRLDSPLLTPSRGKKKSIAQPSFGLQQGYDSDRDVALTGGRRISGVLPCQRRLTASSDTVWGYV